MAIPVNSQYIVDRFVTDLDVLLYLKVHGVQPDDAVHRVQRPSLPGLDIGYDYNNDGTKDLIVSGEWMPISFFEIDGERLINVTGKLNLENTVGWWNSLETADFDNDGSLDIVAGNLGLNSKCKSSEESPFEIFVNDLMKIIGRILYLASQKKASNFRYGEGNVLHSKSR